MQFVSAKQKMENEYKYMIKAYLSTQYQSTWFGANAESKGNIAK